MKDLTGKNLRKGTRIRVKNSKRSDLKRGDIGTIIGMPSNETPYWTLKISDKQYSYYFAIRESDLQNLELI